MSNTLSELNGAEVDLAVFNRASAFMRHQVCQDRVLLLIQGLGQFTRGSGKRQFGLPVGFKYVSGMPN